MDRPRHAAGPLRRAVVLAVLALVTLSSAATADSSSDPLPPAVPAPALDAPELVTETSATLAGDLGMTSLAISWHFEYGPTDAYGTSAPVPEQTATPPADCTSSAPNVARPDFDATPSCPIAAAIFGHVVLPVAGLVPGTVYHVRLVAHDSLGAVASSDATFTTAGSPPPGPPADAGAQPPPVRAAPPAPPRAVLLTRSATVDDAETLTLVVACRGASGHCAGPLLLTTTVRRRARHGIRKVTRTLARATLSLPAGERRHVALTLDRAGVRLLAHANHALAARATFDGASGAVSVRAPSRAAAGGRR